MQLAQQIRNELENPVTAFVSRQAQHRKVYQAGIEKQFKTKQAQEAHVNKAREKYEQDCLRINAYTAQSTLVQGKDLERISVKLERAQQTVHANEREYTNFARALHESVAKWEQEWKQFCDSCQDLEEDRMDFTKDNVWVYANAVSIVCVSDDEVRPFNPRFLMGSDLMPIRGGHDLQSCERLRLALESFEPEKDHENFVRDYGTGNAMPDPPQFVNYSSAEGAPLTSSASKVTSRPAQFSRVTQRINRIATAAPQQPQPEDEPVVNTAGVGSGNRPPNPNDNTLARGLSRSSTRRQAPPTNGNNTTNGPVNGVSPSSSPPAMPQRPPTNNASSAPLTQHELVVGENSYKVDLSKDQQATSRPPTNSSKVGGEADPMFQAMASLRNGAGATVGRSATRRVPAPDAPGTGSVSASPSKALTPPIPVSPTKKIDYRNSAEFVVGGPPAPHSRSTSPVPPTANFMQPPSQAPAPVVDSVIDSYHQSFPGERRSRSNSRRGSFNAPQPVATQQSQASQGNHLERPLSREGGHAGVGANGRSRSPSVGPPASPISPVPSGPARGGNHLDQGSAGQGQYRATTPNSVGIALDPHGNVAMDAMADVYRQQQQAQARQAQAPPPMQALPPAPVQYQQPPTQLQPGGGLAPRPSQRQTGITNPYVPPASWQTQPSAPAPQQYVVSAAATQQAPHHTPAYVQPPHPYANVPPQMYHATQLNYGMQQPPQQPPSQQQQPQQQRQPGQHGSTGSGSGDYYPPPQHQGYAQPPPQQQQQLQRPQPYQHVAYGGGGFRSLSPGPVNRSPSPQPMALTQPQPQTVSEPPTRQYTEDGRGVLFYGAFSFLGEMD